MMRALLSIVGLVLVLYFVLQLGKTQLQALKPPPSAAPGAAGPAAAPNPSNAATEAARRVNEALQQGAAQRASEPAR